VSKNSIEENADDDINDDPTSTNDVVIETGLILKES
jgi:hypothetical protein